jgi:hypothetical protein
MAYFAKVENDVVVEVIGVNNLICGEPELSFPDTEPLGQEYIADILEFAGTWLQTSYNGNFRGTYAGIGYIYNAALDIFVAPLSEPIIEE